MSFPQSARVLIPVTGKTTHISKELLQMATDELDLDSGMSRRIFLDAGVARALRDLEIIVATEVAKVVCSPPVITLQAIEQIVINDQGAVAATFTATWEGRIAP